MSDIWRAPSGHRIDEHAARALVAGDYGVACRKRIMSSCRPIYWWRLGPREHPVLSNGTVTLLQTPTKLLGITAAHVIEGYSSALAESPVRIQISNAVVDDILDRLISVDKALDLATFELDQAIIDQMNGEVAPLNSWPPKPPQEGGGIMIGGFPGIERRIPLPLDISFGLFTALGVARTVSHDQITWRLEREYLVETDDIPTIPQNYDLGGISGGPLITLVESPMGIVSHHLGGIVTQAHSEFEYVVTKRADVIQENGIIRP